MSDDTAALAGPAPCAHSATLVCPHCAGCLRPLSVKEPYSPGQLRPKTVAFREQIWAVLNRFASISVRGVFYALEATGVVRKTENDLQKVNNHLTDMRQRGDVPWDKISEGHRGWWRPRAYRDLGAFLREVRGGYQRDYWQSQPVNVQLLLEKDALQGYITPVCTQYRVYPNVSRGNVSLTQLWKAAQSMRYRNKPVVLLHLADLDGAGIDVSYTLFSRLTEFGVRDLEVRRLAVNPCQVFGDSGVPPRITDRKDPLTKLYKKVYDTKECWELDALVALKPDLIPGLIAEHISPLIDWDAWQREADEEQRELKELDAFLDTFEPDDDDDDETGDGEEEEDTT